MTLDEALRELDIMTKDRSWYRLRVQQLEAKPRIPPDTKELLELVAEQLDFLADRISNRMSASIHELAEKCRQNADS